MACSAVDEISKSVLGALPPPSKGPGCLSCKRIAAAALEVAVKLDSERWTLRIFGIPVWRFKP